MNNSLLFWSCAFILFLQACRSEQQAPQDAHAPPSAAHGTLEGFVRLSGTTLPPPTRIENTTDPQICGRNQTLEDFLISAKTRGIQNVIVALQDVPAAKVPVSPPGHLILDNRECRFVPHVSALMVGSSIEAVNSDATLHNTHFYGALNANLALAVKGVRRTSQADKAGMIIVKCDVHGWMQAFVRIDSHPFHAVTDADGYFRIPGIPAGTYDVEIWHEKLGVLEQTIALESEKTRTINVEYSLNTN